MTRVYKTARGKALDMDKIKLSNELVTAVGNMKVNARGDKLGPSGKIVAGRNQVMDRVYAVEGARSYSSNDPELVAQRESIMQANKAKELHDLTTNLVKNENIETPAPTVPESQPSARGSLASSVAKTTVVKQEPLPDPKKSNGPSRI